MWGALKVNGAFGEISGAGTVATTFTLEKATAAGSQVTVSGTLTVRDQSRPLSFPASVTVESDGVACVGAQVRVDRTDYGITFNMMRNMASNFSDVTVHAVFTRS